MSVASPAGMAFRGVLIQGRSVVDGSMLGSFADTDPNTRLSSCTPPDVRKIAIVI